MITKVYHASVSGIFDNKVRRVPWSDIPVMEFTEMTNFQNADALICAANAFEIVCKEIENDHVEGLKIYDLREILNDYLVFIKEHPNENKSSYLYGDIDVQDIVRKYYFFAGEDDSYMDNRVVFSYFVLIITQKCSLHCKYCGAFCSKYKPQRDYDIRLLKNNMRVLLDAIDGVTELELMGGEPFLYSELDELLRWCIEQNKIHAIKIVTNGTIIPKENIWKLLKHYKVKLVIDDYGEISRNLEKLVELSKLYQVRFEVQKLQTWYQLEPIVKKELQQSYIEQVFHECEFRNCSGILNGKFYRCLTGGHMDNLGLSWGVDGDYVQIEGKQWDTTALRVGIQRLLNINYLESCYFCNYCNHMKTKVAEQE